MASILIVHSAREALRVLAGILRRHGHRALTATDGEKALRLLEGDPTDVVLSDVHLPGMEGIEFLTRVREAFPETRTIAMCNKGSLDKKDVSRAVKSLGMISVLEKPFSPDQCLEAIRLVLEADDEGAADHAEGA